MTVLVNGLAVKRITAVTLVSGRLGRLPLEPEGCEPPEEDELELEDPPPPLETNAVTWTSHEKSSEALSWNRIVREPVVSAGLNIWSGPSFCVKLNNAAFAGLVPVLPLSALMTRTLPEVEVKPITLKSTNGT